MDFGFGFVLLVGGLLLTAHGLDLWDSAATITELKSTVYWFLLGGFGFVFGLDVLLGAALSRDIGRVRTSALR